jgi:hypothetical protein
MALAALVEAAPTTVAVLEAAPAREWAAPAALALSSSSSPLSTSATARGRNSSLDHACSRCSAQVGSLHRVQPAQDPTLTKHLADLVREGQTGSGISVN